MPVLTKYADLVFEKIKNNLTTSLLIVLIVGSFIGYFYANNKKSTSCVVEQVSASENEPVSSSVFVDISGAVNQPGLYELPPDSRVGDVVERSNGYSEEASLEWISKNINLSQKLFDSQKIYIPFVWEDEKNYVLPLFLEDVGNQTSSSGSQSDSFQDDTDSEATESGTKINVNSASLDSLDTLPGIGAVYAQKIVDNRPYEDYEEFKETSGLKSSTLEDIKDLITF